MNILKKVSLFGAAIIMAGGLAACGNKASHKSASNSAKTTKISEKKMSCSKAVKALQSSYKGLATVSYSSKNKSLIFLVNNNNQVNKIHKQTKSSAKWFSKVTRIPDVEAQIKLTKKAQQQQNKMNKVNKNNVKKPVNNNKKKQNVKTLKQGNANNTKNKQNKNKQNNKNNQEPKKNKNKNTQKK